jgi:hypothetical protein
VSTPLPPPSAPVIPVGTPWRFTLRRPVFGALLLAGVFFLYTAPVKESPGLFNHAPWLNDPFDTVISFMMFFVPLIGGFCVPRLLLCRRSEPLPAVRVRDLLRGCRVVLAGISLTLSAEWVSVIVRDNRSQWNGATWLQIGLLTAMSTAAIAVIRELRRVGLPGGAEQHSPSSPDWLADSFLLVKEHSQLLGPVRRPVLGLLNLTEHRLARAIRRHPLWAALGASAVFGAGVGINQGNRESYHLPVTVVVCTLLAVGMFGLLAASGSYLGFIRSTSPLHGTRRRITGAAVITCVGILVPFALRSHLWWLVGSSDSAAGLAQLVQLLGVSAAIIFTAAYVCEDRHGYSHTRSSRL